MKRVFIHMDKEELVNRLVNELIKNQNHVDSIDRIITTSKDKIKQLEKENKQLKDKLKGVQERDYLFNKSSIENKQLKAKLEMYENGVYYSSENDKLKEVIDEVREYLDFIKFDKTDKYIPISEYDEYKHLLQILDKAKDSDVK